MQFVSYCILNPDDVYDWNIHIMQNITLIMDTAVIMIEYLETALISNCMQNKICDKIVNFMKKYSGDHLAN